MFVQIAAGLSYIHSRSVCHRDIKPENIFTSDRGECHHTDLCNAMCVLSHRHTPHDVFVICLSPPIQAYRIIILTFNVFKNVATTAGVVKIGDFGFSSVGRTRLTTFCGSPNVSTQVHPLPCTILKLSCLARTHNSILVYSVAGHVFNVLVVVCGT